MIVFSRGPDGRREVRSVGGGCFTMLAVSVLLSVALTVLLNLLLR
jgi:hypothetical protein